MLTFRPLTPDDQDALWHWLHVALWDPPPAGLRPIETLQAEGVRIYAQAWGQPGDVGVVAQVDGVDAGACWVRLLPAGVGLGSVDAQTPQLGIALEPEFQHQGHGRPLMLALLAAARQAGHAQISLTVHPENPAQHMYERCGFRKVERRNSYHLMVARLDDPASASCVVYAKDLPRVAEFYGRTLSLPVLERDDDFVLIGGAGIEVAVVRIPAAIAAGIDVATPTEPREATPVKCSFLVASLDHVQQEAQATGGGTKPLATAWRWRGQLHLDGHDPEGNVVQFRVRSA